MCCLGATSSIAQTAIKVEDVKSHVGETVKVCTKIYGGKFFEKDTLTLLNAGGYYPDAPLTVVIRANALKEFNNPATYYKGAHVCITGKIELFKDKPQIVVTNKSQILEEEKDQLDKEPK